MTTFAKRLLEMIKQIFIYLTLVLFTTCVAAEDFIMKCKYNIYKYTKDPAGDKVFVKHTPFTNNEYLEWCSKEPHPDEISVEGWVRIIKNNKATCIIEKIILKDNTVQTNTISVNDFINLTRRYEFYKSDRGSKKIVFDEVCKKIINN